LNVGVPLLVDIAGYASQIGNRKSEIGNNIMPADYTINLAKDLTSTQEERTRFYHSMLVYLVGCSAALVFVAYWGSLNVQQFLRNRQERLQLLQTVSATTDIPSTAFRDPKPFYDNLENHAGRISDLRRALEQRVQLLPVIHNLFVDMPKGISLQSLSANKEMLAFGLVMPPSSEQAGGDPVKIMRSAWEKNEELMKRVATIRPVTGERRNMGGKSVFYVQFECVLKK